MATQISRSAITYAHRCTTPTLLVQGEQDFRCPPEQAEQFYAVLKANDCIVEMVRFPNSPHLGSIIGTPIVRSVQNEVLLNWMNRYVLGIEEEISSELFGPNTANAKLSVINPAG